MSHARDEVENDGGTGPASLLHLVPSLEHSITGIITNHGGLAQIASTA